MGGSRESRPRTDAKAVSSLCPPSETAQLRLPRNWGSRSSAEKEMDFKDQRMLELAAMLQNSNSLPASEGFTSGQGH